MLTGTHSATIKFEEMTAKQIGGLGFMSRAVLSDSKSATGGNRMQKCLF